MALVKITTGAEGPGDLTQFFDSREQATAFDFVIDDTSVVEADVWLVLDMVGETSDDRCRTRPGCKIFASAETSWPTGYFSGYPERLDYLRQFDTVYTCHDIPLPNVMKAPPLLPWMINGNHGSVFKAHPRDHAFLRSLDPFPKSKLVSMIVSSKTFTREQGQRLAFAERLKRMLGSDIDWYGTGVQPVDEKWDAIAPYTFHIAMENRILPRVFSEKLVDAFLGWSFPIYWGAPDITSYFPQGSSYRIDLSRPRHAADAVMRALEFGMSDDSLSALRVARGIALGSQSFLSRIRSLAVDALSASPADRWVSQRLVPPAIGNTVGYKESHRAAAGRRAAPRGLRSPFGPLGNSVRRPR